MGQAAGDWKESWTSGHLDGAPLTPRIRTVSPSDLCAVLLNLCTCLPVPSFFFNPCFVWKAFPTFLAHIKMRPVSRGNLRHSLVGGAACQKTPIPWSALGIPGSPGESGLVSRGSQGLRSPLVLDFVIWTLKSWGISIVVSGSYFTASNLPGSY